MDGKHRLCTIPGKFSNRRRDNMIERDSYIRVGLRDWETTKERENCDLLETYNAIEKLKLTNTINENWNIFTPKIETNNDVVHFTDEYEDQQALIKNEIVHNTRSVNMSEDIDIDDI
jgi:hypothetical protein